MTKNNSETFNLSILFYLKKHKFLFIITLLTTFLTSLVTALISIFLQYLIDYVLDNKILLSVILSLSFATVFFIVYIVNSFIKNKLIEKINYEYRSDIFRILLLKNMDEFNQHSVAEYVAMYSNDFKRIEDDYLVYFFGILEHLLLFIMAVVILTFYSWIFTVVMVVMIAILIIIPSLMGKQMEKNSKELSEQQKVVTTNIEETLRGFEVIKTYDKTSLYNYNVDLSNKRLSRSKLKYLNFKEFNESTSGSLGIIMQIVISIIGAYFIYLEELSYGSLLGVIQVSGQIVNPLFQLFALVPTLLSYKPLIDKINEYLKCERYEKKEIEFLNNIKLVNVSFCFGEKRILNNVNLTINKNNKYLIIGESGSGKTTLVKLIAGYYKGYEGEILYDEIPINDADVSSVCKNIGLIHQNIYLFDDTIKNNIIFDLEESDKLKEVIKNSGVERFLDEEGLSKKVGENGKNLSGGQKQRIAVARALYANKPIIILDEGVSALDKQTSYEIENELLDDSYLTIISISHHVNEELLEKYDSIIVIEEGEIIEVSTPETFRMSNTYKKYVK